MRVSADDPIDGSLEGKLVYMSGEAVAAASSSVVTDPVFYSVAPANTLKLRRDVEMYQWEEHKSSHTSKTNGGGSRTETTYSYSKRWNTSVKHSANFYNSYEHENPSSMPYESESFVADPITVGSYVLSSGLVDKINWWKDWVDTDGVLSAEKVADDTSSGGRDYAIAVHGNGFYLGNNPNNPQIGDVRIRFKYIPEGTVSLVAAQMGSSFTPYTTKQGVSSILLLRSGYKSSDELFLLAQRDNTIITWLVRFLGFLLMFIGLKAIAGPLEVVVDKIPCVGRFAGDLMSGATSIATCFAAAALSTLTIAIAWLVYRPLFSFFLLGIVGGLTYLTRKRVDEKRRTTSTGYIIPTAYAVPFEGNNFV